MLGLRGFARNLDDGRVEVLACGAVEALRELESWLWQGPPGARVSDVTTELEPFADHPGFDTC